jgi:ankyrin repeat protein
LFYAVILECKTIIEELLVYEVGPNFTDKNGKSLVHHAAMNVYPDGLHLPLKHDANPNSEDGEGLPALYHAVVGAKKEMAAELLSSGVDPNFRNGRGETLVHLATRMGNVKGFRTGVVIAAKQRQSIGISACELIGGDRRKSGEANKR